MKEFIEKLIGRLEESKKVLEEAAVIEVGTNGHTLDFENYNGGIGAVKFVITLVKHLAEEYNNGWIACSERLPNKEEYLKDDGRFIVTDGNRCYQSIYDVYQGKFRTLKFALGEWVFEEDKCVIEWQPLPELFKEEGAENE